MKVSALTSFHPAPRSTRPSSALTQNQVHRSPIGKPQIAEPTMARRGLVFRRQPGLRLVPSLLGRRLQLLAHATSLTLEDTKIVSVHGRVARA